MIRSTLCRPPTPSSLVELSLSLQRTPPLTHVLLSIARLATNLHRRDIYSCQSAKGAPEVQISSLITFGGLNPEVETFSLHNHYPQVFVWAAL